MSSARPSRSVWISWLCARIFSAILAPSACKATLITSRTEGSSGRMSALRRRLWPTTPDQKSRKKFLTEEAPDAGRRQTPVRPPPVDALPQHNQLRRSQAHRLRAGVRQCKALALEEPTVTAEPLTVTFKAASAGRPREPGKPRPAPPAAFWRSTSCASVAISPIRLRIHVAPQAKYTRNPVPGPIMRHPPRGPDATAPYGRRCFRIRARGPSRFAAQPKL